MNDRDHLRLLTVLTLLSRASTILLVQLSSYLPQFDSSSALLGNSTFLRWDAFHYGHIALHGYVYEYEWAFLPGTPVIMNIVARAWHWAVGSSSNLAWGDVLQGGATAALACDTTRTLYHLSTHVLGSPSAALLTCILSLLPSSPATLRYAPAPEPFFTFLSYRGMLHISRCQWIFACLYFTIAGAFRANGVLLSGFILWGLVVQPYLHHGRIPPFVTALYAALLTTLNSMPFLYHQFSAYTRFCKTSATPASWCSNPLPSIYAYVQGEYWNVGFLRYWTLQQLPNFLIASPVVVLLLYSSCHHITNALIPKVLASSYEHRSGNPRTLVRPVSPFLAETVSPHALHALFLTLTLLFASHTQIILRLAASMPFTYWAAANLVVEKPAWGRIWVGWSAVWGAVSLVLWTTFLPPA